MWGRVLQSVPMGSGLDPGYWDAINRDRNLSVFNMTPVDWHYLTQAVWTTHATERLQEREYSAFPDPRYTPIDVEKSQCFLATGSVEGQNFHDTCIHLVTRHYKVVYKIVHPRQALVLTFIHHGLGEMRPGVNIQNYKCWKKAERSRVRAERKAQAKARAQASAQARAQASAEASAQEDDANPNPTSRPTGRRRRRRRKKHGRSKTDRKRG